jgi:hypothetical protein
MEVAGNSAKQTEKPRVCSGKIHRKNKRLSVGWKNFNPIDI